MKISVNAYNLGSVVICGGSTVHDFANSIACEGMTEAKRERFLRESFAELVANGLITWVMEPDYGNKPSIQPRAFTAAAFLEDWAACFPARTIARAEVPDDSNLTLTIDPLPALGRALNAHSLASKE